MSSVCKGVSSRDKKMALKILQLNLNHCEAAQDLLTQTVREEKIDVVLVADYYRDLDESLWKVDATGLAAIWACGNHPFQETMITTEEYFVRAKVNGVHFYSCYMPPSITQQEFEEVLDRLVADARNRCPVAIAGDFNAWAVEWGSKETKKRGQALLEAFSALNLTLLNDGKLPTFTRGEKSSTIDLTFVSSGLAKGNTGWQVMDICTLSDHGAIRWDIARQHRCQNRPSRTKRHIGWKSSAFDADTLCASMEDGDARGITAEDKVKDVMDKLTRACDAAMPRRGSGNPHTPVYWWSDTIAQLRAKSNRARRLAQRAKGRATFPELEAAFKQARAKLTKAIKSSKRQCWAELVKEVDDDPWGRPYKVVMTKLKGQSRQQPTCPEQLERIVTTLFPAQDHYECRVDQEHAEIIPPITRDELFRACEKIGNTKAPGMDSIPNIALKTAIKAAPKLFLDMYNACLAEGTFPMRWKRQRLVLLPKGNKPPSDPSSYRPLCMLDTAGKILERIIHNRIEVAVGHSLEDNQYGFRKGRSTINAIEHVVGTAKKAISGARWKRGSKKYCLLAALDVKNAFNSARWDVICQALDGLETPCYLRKIIGSYFSNRQLMYDTEDGPCNYRIAGGVPQGSVLGPLLWNIMYNDLLKVKLPRGAEMIAFADDAGLQIVSKLPEEISRIFVESYDEVQRWMCSVGLKLADHKTEAVLFTSRKQRETITLDVGECTIISQPSIRYLGVLIDSRLSFKQHADHAASKARKVATTLARLMPNIGGPRQERRKLLASVVTSVLTYGLAIWGDALKIEEYRRKVAAVHRLSALRVSCAFRTVSDDAACVIAGMMPIEVLAVERKQMYEVRNTVPEERRELEKILKQDSSHRWQEKWDRSEKGRWTHRLIPRIDSWVNRKHGEVNYYLTQMLSNHGCFKAYLHRFKHEDSPECPAGCDVAEDAEHVFFACPRFAEERMELGNVLGVTPNAENLVSAMIDRVENWTAASKFATTIMTKLRTEERDRQKARAPQAGTSHRQ